LIYREGLLSLLLYLKGFQMKIECKLKRNGGSEIQLGEATYKFVPVDTDDETSAHVCEVEDEAHIERLLSITEAYRIHRKPGEAAKPAKPAVVEDVILKNGEQEVNLSKMDGAKLREFAKAQKLPTLPKNMSKAALITAVFEALTAEPK
jgi:hypothetical protein